MLPGPRTVVTTGHRIVLPAARRWLALLLTLTLAATPVATPTPADAADRGHGAEFVTALHQALMASPGHRRNLLDPAFTELRIGVVVRDQTVWVTQGFRQRAPHRVGRTTRRARPAAAAGHAGSRARTCPHATTSPSEGGW